MDKSDIEVEIKKGDQDRATRADKANQAFEKARTEQDNARMSLAEFRWHWTRDTTNPDKVSQKEYATITGVSDNQISVYSRGYEMYLEDDTRPLGECLLRAKLGEERFAAVEQVARMRRVTLATADAKYKTDIKAVVEKRRKDADEKMTAEKGAAEAAKAPAQVVTSNGKSTPKTTPAAKGSSKAPKSDGKSADTKPAFTSTVVEAEWEAPTDQETNEALMRFSVALGKAEQEARELSYMRIPADQIIDRTEIMDGMIKRAADLRQALLNLQVAAKIDVNDKIKETR